MRFVGIDEIAVIDHGRVIAEGTSDELKRRVGGDRLEIERVPGPEVTLALEGEAPGHALPLGAVLAELVVVVEVRALAVAEVEVHPGRAAQQHEARPGRGDHLHQVDVAIAGDEVTVYVARGLAIVNSDQGRAEVENAYPRVVRREGNPAAQVIQHQGLVGFCQPQLPG